MALATYRRMRGHRARAPTCRSEDQEIGVRASSRRYGGCRHRAWRRPARPRPWPGRRGDARHVERAARRPMARGDRDQGQRRGAARSIAPSPPTSSAVRWLLHRLDAKPPGSRPGYPFSTGRWVSCSHQQADAARLSAPCRRSRRRSRPRDQRDVDGIGADQAAAPCGALYWLRLEAAGSSTAGPCARRRRVRPYCTAIGSGL